MLMHAEEFLAFRQQLGYKLLREGYLLREFGRYADESGHTGPITNELVLRWVRLPRNATPNYWRNACLSFAAWPAISPC